MSYPIVIVSAARTPIGRANKGSLVDCRPDDLTANIVKAALEKRKARQGADRSPETATRR